MDFHLDFPAENITYNGLCMIIKALEAQDAELLCGESLGINCELQPLTLRFNELP